MNEPQKKNIQMLVTFLGEASGVTVYRLADPVPELVGRLVVSGRSWGDLEKAMMAAALESQGRPSSDADVAVAAGVK